jgi:predicted Zn finger-like uncharacterized protein
VKDVSVNQSTEYTAPATCPSCRSSSIVTKAKTPDTATYWRCTACGEIWNVARTVRTLADSQKAYRWR